MDRLCELGDVIRCEHLKTIPRDASVIKIHHLRSHYQQDWVVTKVFMAGGTTGRDPWPDVPHVIVCPLNSTLDTVVHEFLPIQFAQSDCFNIDHVIKPEEIHLIETVEIVTRPVIRRVVVP